MVLMGSSGARGTLIDEKNLMSKISCQTPFNLMLSFTTQALQDPPLCSSTIQSLAGSRPHIDEFEVPQLRELIKLQGWAGVAARVIYIFIYTYRLYREGDFTLIKKFLKQESGARYVNFSSFVYSDRPFYTILTALNV
jgi:hypothetical protein